MSDPSDDPFGRTSPLPQPIPISHTYDQSDHDPELLSSRVSGSPVWKEFRVDETESTDDSVSALVSGFLSSRFNLSSSGGPLQGPDDILLESDGLDNVFYTDTGYNVQPSALFRAILHPDRQQRRIALKVIIQELRRLCTQNVQDHLFPTLTRLAFEAPFADIRQAFGELVTEIEANLHICLPRPPSVSAFFPTSALPSVDDDVMFQAQFLDFGRVLHVFRVMGAFPAFASLYYTTYVHVMREDGPLPPDWRPYLALMAASCHKCEYLTRWQEAEFVRAGGDISWLQHGEGAHNVPRKLQLILQYNALLAHQPWRITPQHIEALCKGPNSWTIAEVVHATVILASFHALAGLVFGCGVTRESDDFAESMDTPTPQAVTPAEQSESIDAETRRVIQQLQLQLSSSPTSSVKADSGPSSAEDKNASFRSRLTPPVAEEESESGAAADNAALRKISSAIDLTTPTEATPDAAYSASGSASLMSAAASTTPAVASVRDNAYFSAYLGNYVLEYEDFDGHNREYAPVYLHDSNWEDTAFGLIDRYYGSAAELLDHEFEMMWSLTDRTFHDTHDVDTTKFRWAIRAYVNRLYGMFHDDYAYSQTNLLLNRHLKTYIKRTVCAPEKITSTDFGNLGLELRPQEKVHINLLCVEQRKQAEIVYGMRAINSYLTKR